MRQFKPLSARLPPIVRLTKGLGGGDGTPRITTSNQPIADRSQEAGSWAKQGPSPQVGGPPLSPVSHTRCCTDAWRAPALRAQACRGAAVQCVGVSPQTHVVVNIAVGG